MTTETIKPEQDAGEWSDYEYRHCFHWISGTWDGRPAKCGYPGPPKSKGPVGFIPKDACPICLALYKR